MSQINVVFDNIDDYNAQEASWMALLGIVAPRRFSRPLHHPVPSDTRVRTSFVSGSIPDLTGLNVVTNQWLIDEGFFDLGPDEIAAINLQKEEVGKGIVRDFINDNQIRTMTGAQAGYINHVIRHITLVSPNPLDGSTIGFNAIVNIQDLGWVGQLETMLWAACSIPADDFTESYHWFTKEILDAFCEKMLRANIDIWMQDPTHPAQDPAVRATIETNVRALYNSVRP